MPSAIITVGLPGCGKSYYAKKMRFHGYRECNLDRCRKLICGDEANQAVTGDAVRFRDALLDMMIEDEDHIVISDTNLNTRFRHELIAKLKNAGYEVHIVAFAIPFEICQQRNANRDRVVPEHAMERMADAYAGLKLDKDGVDSIHVVSYADQLEKV